MKDQHEQIKGYRDLTQSEIDLMNEIKAEGERLQALCAKVQKNLGDVGMLPHEADRETAQARSPHRWLSMAQTDLQVGVMKLVRAVARPSSF